MSLVYAMGAGSAHASPILAAPYLPPTTSDVVIDLSHWQTSVNFVSAKAAGITAVILKATQGSRWIDKTFTMRYAAAHAAGLLVGAYHFLDNSPPERQVKHLLSVAGDCRVLALDAEPQRHGPHRLGPAGSGSRRPAAYGDRSRAAHLCRPLWSRWTWNRLSEFRAVALPAVAVRL